MLNKRKTNITRHGATVVHPSKSSEETISDILFNSEANESNIEVKL